MQSGHAEGFLRKVDPGDLGPAGCHGLGEDAAAAADIDDFLAGDLGGAVDQLLAIVKADREWNDQAARKQLLVVFDAAGGASEVARDGRRRLSSILFA